METDTQTTVDSAAPVQDTAAPQDSATSTQVTEAPEATQEQAVAQEATSTEVNATDTAEEKLYAGKYKTVEDMEKAYQQLQSTYTTTSQEKAELAKILNESFAAPEVQSAQTDTDSYYAEESNPLMQEVEKLKVQTAVQTFILSHNDADAASMQEVINNDPIIAQISSPEAKLEYAYLRSQNMGQKKAIAEAQKQAVQQTQVKIAEKQAAQVETVKQTEQPDENAELMEKMRTGTTQERQNARLQYIRKNLV